MSSFRCSITGKFKNPKSNSIQEKMKPIVMVVAVGLLVATMVCTTGWAQGTATISGRERYERRGSARC
jgi:hypothetical protein